MNADGSQERSNGSFAPAQLARNEVRVWTVFSDEVRDPELLAAYETLMNEEERAREQRYRFERGRHECRVTRALVRTTLSRYADVPPEGWTFVLNRYGRPSITPGQCELPLRFNLAHTRGLIACAVTLEHDIGVDVECLDRRSDTVALADHFFSASEVADLHALPEDRQHERFFHYWTLKESYIKARGMGLAIPLDQFAFHLDDDLLGDEVPGDNQIVAGKAPIRISFDPRLDDDPKAWTFELHAPTQRHRLAVGVRSGSGARTSIVVERTVPLVT